VKEFSKPLPKNLEALPGAVVPQYREYKGKQLGPYWFRVWRSGGSLYKVYVPASEIESVRACCDAWCRRRAENRRRRDESMARLKELKQLLKQYSRTGGIDW
jgi:hypothetical protein